MRPAFFDPVPTELYVALATSRDDRRYRLLCSGLLPGCGVVSCCGAGGRFECVPVALVAFACEPFCVPFPVFALPEGFSLGFDLEAL